jgi:alpha-beta hydrolase superfamily lysophospholipase
MESNFLHTEFFATTKDGLRLFGQSWMPPVPRGIIVLVHGLAEHSGRYENFAKNANIAGLGVFAIDLRGHGRSPGEAMWINSFDEYLLDVDALVQTVKQSSARCPLFLMGHSLGGAIAVRWLSQRVEQTRSLHGLILSSAALEIGPGTPALLIKLAPFISRWLPRLRTQALDSNLISSIPSEVARYRNDPLVCLRAPPARTGAQVLAVMPANLAAASKLTLPLYIFHGTADTLTSPAGSQAFHAAWGGSDRALRLWTGSMHETLNDIDGEAVMNELFAWLLPRCERILSHSPTTGTTQKVL